MPVLVSLGFLPYEPDGGFWQDLIWLVQGRPRADAWRVAIAGSAFGTLSLILGWVAQGILIEGFGVRTGRRTEQADDYDDKPTTD